MRVIGILFIVCKISSRAESKQEREPLFNLKVLSVLSSKFLACHGESLKKIKRELKLILQTGFLKSCESQEPSLVPGQSTKSPFFIWRPLVSMRMIGRPCLQRRTISF